MRLLLAARDLPVEPAIVQSAPDSSLEVVRRCLDTADLVAAASIESDVPVVVSMGFPRLGSDVIQALGNRRLMALVRGDRESEQARQWGIAETIPSDLTGPEIAQRIRNVLSGGVWSIATNEVPTGTVISIVSAAGAPGRTRLAIALARCGRTSTCLVDADTRSPAVAIRLGVLDDISGLALAVRHLNNGSLHAGTMRSSCARLDDHQYLLTGCTEVSEAQIGEVISIAARTFDRVIVDTAPVVECPGSAPVLPGHSTKAAVAVVMTPDDVSVTRTIRLLANQPMMDGVIAVHGLRRRASLRSLKSLFAEQGIEMPLVPASEVPRIYAHVRAAGPNA